MKSILGFLVGLTLMACGALALLAWALRSNGGGNSLTDQALPALFERAVMREAARNDSGFSVGPDGRYSAVYVYELADMDLNATARDQLPDLAPLPQYRNWSDWIETVDDPDMLRQRCGRHWLADWQNGACALFEGIYRAGRDCGWYRLSPEREHQVAGAWSTQGSFYACDGRFTIFVMPADGLILLVDWS